LAAQPAKSKVERRQEIRNQLSFMGLLCKIAARKDVKMVGVAVIGAGNWGKNLVRNFAALNGCELKYVVDCSEKVREAMAAGYPQARVVGDMREALADASVSAVVIAAQAHHHFKLAKAALIAGKNTYVEKPMTLSAADATELVELASSKGLKLMVGHLLEYHPAVNFMKEMIAAGEVGRPLYLCLERLNLGIVRKAENAWWSLAPHDISMACYLLDAQPVSVSATGQAYLGAGVEDVVFANLKFADGRMAHIHVSWLDPHKVRRATLVGSRKMVVFDDMDASQKIRIYDKGADVTQSVNSYVEAITLRTGDILIPQISSAEPLKLECQHFIDSVAGNSNPRSDGADGVRVVKVLEAGSQSLARGGEPVAIA
jgi:predicted dehydrogenase